MHLYRRSALHVNASVSRFSRVVFCQLKEDKFIKQLVDIFWQRRFPRTKPNIFSAILFCFWSTVPATEEVRLSMVLSLLRPLFVWTTTNTNENTHTHTLVDEKKTSKKERFFKRLCFHCGKKRRKQMHSRRVTATRRRKNQVIFLETLNRSVFCGWLMVINGSYWAELSCGAVYHAVKGGLTFEFVD